VSWEDAKVAVVPIPYDSTVSYKVGSRYGPAAILDASRQVETFDEEIGRDTSDVGIYTLPELEPDMRGPGAMLERVYQAVKPVVDAGKLLVALGGEHSLSLSTIRPCAEKYENLSVLQIDAHLDLRNTYEQTPFSHASVMRRVRDYCPVVPVGIRNVSEEEHEYVKEEGIRVFYARDIVGRSNNWEHQVLDQLTENVFVTIDVDGLDPSVIPATGTPEPGGLGWYETLRMLRMVCHHKNVVGFDIMELSPMPPYHSSEFACARLAYKMLGYLFEPSKEP
jgi:agmatinase